MKQKKVLSRKELPTTLPLWSSVTLYLLLDKLNATPIWYGIIGTLYALIWIGSIYSIATEKETKLFEDGIEGNTNKSAWKQRLDDMANK